MANNSGKPWDRPWTMDEMIENANNWSLAGDAVLLNTLKSFSNNLLSQSVEISDKVDNLLNGLDEVGLKLDITKNEFLSLRNTQFIESRVLEEDETLYTQVEHKVEEKQLSEDDKNTIIKESVLRGLEVMDKYFDKVQVSLSDTEDESDNSYILRPKDLYADRPLPYIIGSEDWYKKWHVGLIDSSDSESEKDVVDFSDADTENDLPKDHYQMKGSETSSEIDFSNKIGGNKPVANSTFNDSTRQAGLSDSDEQNSVPVQAPMSTQNFAEQLAAKLGNISDKKVDLHEPEINTRPIQKNTTNRNIGDFFSDEPPPLANYENTLPSKNSQGGLFSDEQDEPFWGQNENNSNTKSMFKNEISSVTNSIGYDDIPDISHTSSKITKGLFDSDDSSEDDLFTGNKKQPVKQSYIQSYKTPIPFFDDEPPELEPKQKTTEQGAIKKKPVGGISVFGNSNIFGDQKISDILTNRQKSSTETSDESKENTPRNSANDFTENIVQNRSTAPKSIVSEFENKEKQSNVNLLEEKKHITTLPQKSKPAVSLFDEDDDLFKDDLFGNVSTKKFTSSLFDEPDMFKSETPKNDSKNSRVSSLNKTGLFDDDNNIITEDLSATNKDKKFDLFVDKNENLDIHDNVQVSSNSSINFNANDKVKLVEENYSKSNDSNKTKEELAAGVDNNKTIENAASDAAKSLERRESLNNRSLFNAAVDVFKATPESISNVGKQTNAKLFEDSYESVLNNNEVLPPPINKQEKFIPALNIIDSTPPPLIEEISKPRKKHSIFDSNPPSDDEWDIKPNNDYDDDVDDIDPFSFHYEPSTTQRSSLFDVEPPSLGPDDSSGIVTDENNTRVDTTDDSSFYPYASSSRRLSSDIFSEQQSNDGLFVTKNRTESVAASALNIIPEISNISQSNLDITPSGNPKDLSDTSGKRDSVFDKINETERKPVKIHEEINKLNCGNTEPQRVEKSKIQSITEQLQKEDSLSPKAKITGSPGKLKHNLNINVNALIPGLGPPKRKDLIKSKSMDDSNTEDNPNDTESLASISTKDDLVETSPFASLSNTETKEIKEEFTSPSNNLLTSELSAEDVQVLQSITKDRVRTVKRRPSTRKGRQEALRKSVPDFNLPDDATNLNPDDQQTGDTANIEQCNFAKTEEVVPVKNTEREIKNSLKDIFNDDDVRDFDSSLEIKPKAKKSMSPKIFGDAADKDVFSPLEKTSRNSGSSVNLFDDIFAGSHSKPKDIDIFSQNRALEDDIFRHNVRPTISTNISFVSQIAAPPIEVSKNADDLFSKSSSNVPKSQATTSKVFYDDTDLFGAKESKVVSRKSKNTDLFDSGGSDDELFSSRSSKRPTSEKSTVDEKSVKSTKRENDLFDDADDIFSSQKRIPNMDTSKKSLFDDSSDDDDIFQSNKVSSGSKGTAVKKTPKTSIVKKLANKTIDDDPLSALLK